jgi:hypothetical protein
VGVSAVVLFLASCATESPVTSSGALIRGRSSLDPPPAPVEDGLAVAPTHIAGARVPGGRQVGHYDMSAQQGQPYEVPPIVAAGGTAVNVLDPDAATLGNLNVLWVDNPENSFYDGKYVLREPEIAAAVQSGLILVLHDRFVEDAESNLPGATGFNIVRDFTEGADINIRDGSTLVTKDLDNTSLDNGTFSSHGFALDVSLPARAKLILTATSNDHIVTFCYPLGRGAVIYSTIPLDFYLQGFGTDPPGTDMAKVYAPNVVSYALAGACALRAPRPTPNLNP